MCFSFLIAELIYEPTTLSNDDIDREGLGQDIPQVILSRDDVILSGFDTLLANTHGFTTSTSERHNLNHHIFTVLRNQRTGFSEDGLHGRDDGILNIIRTIALMSVMRNNETPSSVFETRPDACLYHSQRPSLVVMEEKSDKTSIGSAKTELHKKFLRDLPHYGPRIKWIIGIAVGGDEVVFGKIHRDTSQFTELVSFDLEFRKDRLPCVRAAINVARWCLWVHQSKLLYPLPADIRSPDRRSRCTLSFSPPYVYKEIKEGHWNTDIVKFYSEVACGNESDHRGAIPHLEWATTVLPLEGTLHLKLKPLGISRLPDDTEIHAALRCVLTALAALHKNKWAHLDLRWPNVVGRIGFSLTRNSLVHLVLRCLTSPSEILQPPKLTKLQTSISSARCWSR